MNIRKNGGFLTLFMLLSGSIAMILRRQMYLTTVDEKGLLLRNSPLQISLMLLTVIVLIIPVLLLLKKNGSGRYADNYSGSYLSALGHIAAAVGIFLAVYPASPVMDGYLGTAWKVLGFAAPACLILAGFQQLSSRPPFFLLHVVPAMFFTLHIVSCYRLWSSNPQMQDYLFALLASLALTLFSHYTAAFEVGLGNRKLVLGAGLAAVFLCLAEMGCAEHPAFYFGCVLWALTGICKVTLSQTEEKD